MPRSRSRIVRFESLESRALLAVSAGTLGVAAIKLLPREPIVPNQPALVLTANPTSPIQINLAWRFEGLARAAGSGYVVERASDGQSWMQVKQLAAGVMQYSDLGLVSNSSYTYRVRPAGSSVMSNDATATTPRYDAGLSSPFLMPSPVTGQTRSILSYGATPNNSSNDDATAIKNAIAASSVGDEVYIPDGVYHIKARDIRLKTGVSIRGQSRDGAILSALFTDAGTDNPNSQMFRATPGVNNINISNLTIDMAGGQSLQYAFYLGSGSTGVENVSRIAIKNVKLEDFEKFAVAIRNGDNILVEDSLIRNATALGGGGEGYGVMIGYDNSFNNWIKGNTIGPVIRHAVVVQYRAHHNLIENNVAIDNTLDSYDLHGEDEYSNEIRYNVAYGCGGFGIGIGNTGSTHDDAGPDNWVHHNEVYDSRGGVNIILGSDRQYIEDNYFHHNSNEGILVNNGGGNTLWFLRNTVRFNGTGAKIEQASDVLMIDNTITDNTGTGVIVAATTSGYNIFRNDLRSNAIAAQLFSAMGIFDDNLM